MAMNTVHYKSWIVYHAQRVVRCVLIINFALMHIRFAKIVVDHAFNLIYYIIIIEINISSMYLFYFCGIVALFAAHTFRPHALDFLDL